MNLFFEKHLLWWLKINSLLVTYLDDSYICFLEFLVVSRSIEIYSKRFAVITYKHSIYISTCFPFISSAHVSFCERRNPPSLSHNFPLIPKVICLVLMPPPETKCCPRASISRPLWRLFLYRNLTVSKNTLLRNLLEKLDWTKITRNERNCEERSCKYTGDTTDGGAGLFWNTNRKVVQISI